MTRAAPRAHRPTRADAVAVDGGRSPGPHPRAGRRVASFTSSTAGLDGHAARHAHLGLRVRRERRIGSSTRPRRLTSATRLRVSPPARARRRRPWLSADGVVFSADSGAAAMPRGGPGGSRSSSTSTAPGGHFRPTTPPAPTRAGRRDGDGEPRGADERATPTTSFAAFGLTRLELDDARVRLTLANGTVVARAFLEGSKAVSTTATTAVSRNARARAFLASTTARARARAAKDVTPRSAAGKDRRRRRRARSRPPRERPVQLVNGTDGIGARS